MRHSRIRTALRRSVLHALGCVIAVGLLLGCRPTTIAEEERRSDDPWLDQNGTPNAVEALGRLADDNAKALAAIRTRSSFDVQAFKAAWTAVLRRAPGGTSLLHDGLTDPRLLDLPRARDGPCQIRKSSAFADLEAALVRLSASTQNFNVSSVLASAGPAAHDAIERRLEDASTRGAMCRGIASKGAAPGAHKVLLGAPEAARDSPTCVLAVVGIAVDDDAVLAWLAERGEPGMLGAASKEETLPCARLHVAWTRALTSRDRNLYSP